MNKKEVFPKGGCLIFYGDIFGGRFHENYHQIIDYEYDEMKKIFHFHFNEGETCMIYEPTNISYGEKAFVIKDASHITWEWYYYGREKNIENLNSWNFERIDTSLVSKTSSGNLSTGIEKTTFDRENQPALQFV